MKQIKSLQMKSKASYLLGGCLISCISGCSGVLDQFSQVDSYPDLPSYYVPSNDLPQDYSMPRERVMNDQASDKYYVKSNPIRPRESDLYWVNQQPSEGYTIELARSVNASEVAKHLQKAPKTERRGEISTSQGYIGVFGSFNSENAAAQALANLPEEVRKDAKVVQWRNIQKR